jgi:hypothetical protein
MVLKGVYSNESIIQPYIEYSFFPEHGLCPFSERVRIQSNEFPGVYTYVYIEMDIPLDFTWFENIEIEQPAERLLFQAGERFDATGLIIAAACSYVEGVMFYPEYDSTGENGYMLSLEPGVDILQADLESEILPTETTIEVIVSYQIGDPEVNETLFTSYFITVIPDLWTFTAEENPDFDSEKTQSLSQLDWSLFMTPDNGSVSMGIYSETLGMAFGDNTDYASSITLISEIFQFWYDSFSGIQGVKIVASGSENATLRVRVGSVYANETYQLSDEKTLYEFTYEQLMAGHVHIEVTGNDATFYVKQIAIDDLGDSDAELAVTFSKSLQQYKTCTEAESAYLALIDDYDELTPEAKALLSSIEMYDYASGDINYMGDVWSNLVIASNKWFYINLLYTPELPESTLINLNIGVESSSPLIFISSLVLGFGVVYQYIKRKRLV